MFATTNAWPNKFPPGSLSSDKTSCMWTTAGQKFQRSCYPSPPMSRPSTPQRGSIGSYLHISASEPHPATSLAGTSSFGTTTDTVPIQRSTFVAPPDVLAEAAIAETVASTESLALSARYITAAAPQAPLTTRVPRKPKAHVASACINCKKAHLSCDVDRPCRRCRDTGKEDTCYDIQHKKRGRPRLRDDTETVIASSSQQNVVQQKTPRPIATTRSRRAASFRSHQSQGSEGSSRGQITPTSRYAPMGHSSHQLTETPLAILDVDLNIMRTTESLRNLFGISAARSQTHVGELIAPAEGYESFANLRNRLRAEREQRDPSYLPPILEHGRDPLADIDEYDLGRWLQGPLLTSHRWTSRQAQSSTTSFPVNIWLAKSSLYFVVVTMSTISPIQLSPTSSTRPRASSMQSVAQSLQTSHPAQMLPTSHDRDLASTEPRIAPRSIPLAGLHSLTPLDTTTWSSFPAAPGTRRPQHVVPNPQAQQDSAQSSLQQSPFMDQTRVTSTTRGSLPTQAFLLDSLPQNSRDVQTVTTPHQSAWPPLERFATISEGDEGSSSGSEAPTTKRRRRIDIDDVLE